MFSFFIAVESVIIIKYRQVAILEIHGKDYAMKPITLQTVRPFVLDEMRLSDVADAGALDLNDRAAITQLLKDRVSPDILFPTNLLIARR